MDNHFTEQDWKLFRTKIVGWQEDYMKRLNQEYIEILTTDADASEKFWTLEKRIRKDKRSVGVQIDMRRSSMIDNLRALFAESVINEKDLEPFSKELKNQLHI